MPRQEITRADISPFVAHLTKHSDQMDAAENLVSILKCKCIEARNPHCLFNHAIENNNFDENLRQRFYTVCFTETPLSQIRFLSEDIPGRSVHLKPYGLVFRRTDMLDEGGSPALYINAHGTTHRNLLLKRFANDFDDVETYVEAKRKHRPFTNSLISHYALCNIISDRHDFSWEREWRHCGDFQFKYYQVVAILVDDVSSFARLLQRRLSSRKLAYIQKVPLINPEWNYEKVVDQMSLLIKATYDAFNEERV